MIGLLVVAVAVAVAVAIAVAGAVAVARVVLVGLARVVAEQALNFNYSCQATATSKLLFLLRFVPE